MTATPATPPDTSPASAPRSPGRPRDSATDARILDAVRALLDEGGIDAVTVEGVAARAGVAKTTVYRRYADRDELALSVLLDVVRGVGSVPELDDARAELAYLLRGAVAVLRTTRMGDVLRGLASELAGGGALATAFREQVLALQRAEVARVVAAGVRRGQLRPDLDAARVHELLLGPVHYRLLVTGGDLPDAYAHEVVDAVYPALEADPDEAG